MIEKIKEVLEKAKYADEIYPRVYIDHVELLIGELERLQHERDSQQRLCIRGMEKVVDLQKALEDIAEIYKDETLHELTVCKEMENIAIVALERSKSQ